MHHARWENKPVLKFQTVLLPGYRSISHLEMTSGGPAFALIDVTIQPALDAGTSSERSANKALAPLSEPNPIANQDFHCLNKKDRRTQFSPQIWRTCIVISVFYPTGVCFQNVCASLHQCTPHGKCLWQPNFKGGQHATSVVSLSVYTGNLQDQMQGALKGIRRICYFLVQQPWLPKHLAHTMHFRQHDRAWNPWIYGRMRRELGGWSGSGIERASMHTHPGPLTSFMRR